VPKFRKKPVVIEATQFTGDNAKDLRNFTDGQFNTVDVDDRGDDPEIVAEVFDVLHSTWVGVKEGQWIIRGVQGEFYPCDADVFVATYDAVEVSA
jgi:hypothetical protein